MRRLLQSQFVDLLVGPHGVDRYLELIRPSLTVNDARAQVVEVRRQTARSVTLTLRPNAAWRGFNAGQFVRVGVEIDGVRILSMLRTLCDEGYAGDVSFIHYARTRGDWLYRAEVEALAAARGNVKVSYVATREGGRRLCPDDVAGRHVAVCGPPSLLDAARPMCEPDRLLMETFTPPSLTVNGEAASGELRLLRSELAVPIATGTLLEQVEAAGVSPDFGCRMGICRTCTCRKTAGAVRNVLTDEISDEEDEDIQLCVSVPAGDVELQI